MSGAEVALGTFGVEAKPAGVAAFRAATGLPADDETVPLTFPIRWLALPEVRKAVTDLVPDADVIPFHESQTFDYTSAPLRIGEPYTLTVTARRLGKPDRLDVDATIAAADGVPRATVETVLRLFSTRQAAP